MSEMRIYVAVMSDITYFLFAAWTKYSVLPLIEPRDMNKGCVIGWCICIYVEFHSQPISCMWFFIDTAHLKMRE
jgi:hypothetical protein